MTSSAHLDCNYKTRNTIHSRCTKSIKSACQVHLEHYKCTKIIPSAPRSFQVHQEHSKWIFYLPSYLILCTSSLAVHSSASGWMSWPNLSLHWLAQGSPGVSPVHFLCVVLKIYSYNLSGDNIELFLTIFSLNTWIVYYLCF